MHMPGRMCGDQRTSCSCESQFSSSHHVGLGNSVQTAKLGSKSLHLLGHLVSPWKQGFKKKKKKDNDYPSLKRFL